MKNDNSTKLINPWFEHDENASSNGKFLRMFRDFRKLAKEMEKAELESFVTLGAYAIFWRLAEFMHGNNLHVGDEDIIADDLRIDVKFVEKILNEYELFYTKDGLYISDRILKNLERRKSKSKKNTDAINSRWLLFYFDKAYNEFFDETPVLSDKEIETLKKYSKKIPDFKDKLRDIIYTLSVLKFDTNINFKPCANWLLEKNNLARLVNGEFGKLQHKATEEELKEERKQAKEKEQEQAEELQTFDSKAKAVEYIKSSAPNTKFLSPIHKQLMKQFDITVKELDSG